MSEINQTLRTLVITLGIMIVILAGFYTIYAYQVSESQYEKCTEACQRIYGGASIEKECVLDCQRILNCNNETKKIQTKPSND